MSTETTSRLSGLRFVNPQHAADDALQQTFRTVPAGGSTQLPGESHDLDVAIAGAGRMFDLAEWNAFTHGTSLVVLRHGRVLHEWYAEGLGPDDCFLGASMTKSVLAHLVGRAVRASVLSLTDRVAEHYEKKNGTLEFVSLVCEARKADGELALTIRRVLVVRHA